MARKNCKNLYSTSLNGTVFHRVVQKTFAIPNLVWRQDSRIYHLSSEKSETWIFFASNSPKQISTAENLEYDWSWTCRSVFTKIGQTRPIGAEKINFKELKRRGTSRTRKKNEIIFTYPCANRRCSASLKTQLTLNVRKKLSLVENAEGCSTSGLYRWPHANAMPESIEQNLERTTKRYSGGSR